MNRSKYFVIIAVITVSMIFILGACGILPSEVIDNATTPSATTPTQTSTPDVIDVTFTPSPPPTQPPLPILTPDAIQLERWQEYQTELAKVLLYGYDIDASKDALCEWDILGRSGEEVYVWALCASVWGSGSRPAVIYLEADGAIRDVKVAGYKGPFYDLELFRQKYEKN